MVKKQYDCQSYRFLSFFKNLILKAMKKQRLLNKDNSILFFDSTDIKANPDAKKTSKGESPRRSWYLMEIKCSQMRILHI